MPHAFVYPIRSRYDIQTPRIPLSGSSDLAETLNNNLLLNRSQRIFLACCLQEQICHNLTPASLCRRFSRHALSQLPDNINPEICIPISIQSSHVVLRLLRVLYESAPPVFAIKGWINGSSGVGEQPPACDLD